MNKKNILKEGSKRIKIKDLKEYIKKDNNWIKTENINENIKKLIEKYSINNNIHILLDENNQEFLKGYINPNEIISGSRITILPNGEKIARGGFSIFAKNLKFNNNSKYEWDICYENTSGLKTYLYSEDKIELERRRKTKIVNAFIREYDNILEKLELDIKKQKKVEYLVLYLLIMTYIRVGNIEYYNLYKHKGLTTLQKKDITIKNNKINFKFIGKDGVPQDITKEFPEYIIKQLETILNEKENNEFVFTDKKSHPIHSYIFSKILFKYTKKHFYPHIIRSYHVDSECRKFIKNHKAPQKKKNIINKFKDLALDLGHKKYNKKTKQFIPDYKTTIDNYIRPEYVEKMKNLILKE